MSYVIAAISNAGGAPEQAYRKMQSAGACPERPYAGMYHEQSILTVWLLSFNLFHLTLVPHRNSDVWIHRNV